MPEVLNRNIPEFITYKEAELRRHLINRGCPKRMLSVFIEKYLNLQLRAERQLWQDTAVVTIHKPIPNIVLSDKTSLPAGLLEDISRVTNLPSNKNTLNSIVIERDKFIPASTVKSMGDESRFRTGARDVISLAESVLNSQGPFAQPVKKAVKTFSYGIFVVEPYGRAHIVEGGVYFPGVSSCTNALFRDQNGSISAAHMHSSENPSIQDLDNLLNEHESLFGSNSVGGGHLTVVGLELPWELLKGIEPEQRPALDLMYPSPALREFATDRGVSLSRPRICTNQRTTRVGQLYATTDPSNPVVWTSETAEGVGYSVIPPGFIELEQKIISSYEV